MNDVTQFAWAFGMGFCLDLVFTWYIKAAQIGAKVKAALYSVGAASISVYGTISIYDDRWLAIPYFFGLFTGTIAALSLVKEKSD